MWALLTLVTLFSSSGDLCERAVRLGFGCIDVPCDYRVVHTAGRVDYWFGYVEPPDGAWRVNWSAGMVGDPLTSAEAGDGSALKEIALGSRKLTLGRIREDGVELLVLRDGRTNFMVPSETPSAEAVLRDLALRFRGKTSTDCEPAELESSAEPHN